jgi:hypothetical protein
MYKCNKQKTMLQIRVLRYTIAAWLIGFLPVLLPEKAGHHLFTGRNFEIMSWRLL